MSEGKDRGEATFDWLSARRKEKQPAANPEPQAARRPDATPTRRRRARRGKRNDPAYHQASAYVRKDVYRKVQQALLSQEEGVPDYSTLVEALLLEWLEKNGWDVKNLR